MADALEAVIGAVFMDGGFEAAREFVLRTFQSEFGEVNAIPMLETPKGELQEMLQARAPQSPVYQIVSSSGPDHDRVFECVVSHGAEVLGRGQGKSKKAAESEAALSALRRLREAKAAAANGGDGPKTSSAAPTP